MFLISFLGFYALLWDDKTKLIMVLGPASYPPLFEPNDVVSLSRNDDSYVRLWESSSLVTLPGSPPPSPW